MYTVMAQEANRAATTAQLEGYNQKGLDALGSGYQAAKDSYDKYQTKTLDALGSAYTTGRNDLSQGYGQAANDVRTGIEGLNPWVERGNQAGAMYGNALGLNGAAGNQAATSAFQAGPGYEWQRDQAVDGAARKANALGISASGNTLDAITRLGSNLANQEYGSWLDRLNGVNTQGQAAATSQLGGYQNLGALAAQGGAAQATLAQNYGQNQAAAFNDAGKTLATLGYQQGKDTSGRAVAFSAPVSTTSPATYRASIA